jgi:hypothetical protein
VYPGKGIGEILLGESFSDLKQRLLYSNLALQKATSDIGAFKGLIYLGNEFLGSIIFSEDERVIAIEIIVSDNNIFYKETNLSTSNYLSLKRRGQIKNYEVSDFDMGFTWDKLRIGFFFEEENSDAHPDAISLYNEEYEITLRNLMEDLRNEDFEEEDCLYDMDNNMIVPHQSIGDFLLGESLNLMKFRFDCGDCRIVESEFNRIYLIYFKNEKIVRLSFSEELRVKSIRKYNKPFNYKGEDLSKISYKILKSIALNNGTRIKEEPQKLIWSDLGIIFYFEENENEALPQFIEIYKSK